MAHVVASVQTEYPTTLTGAAVLSDRDEEAVLTPLHLAWQYLREISSATIPLQGVTMATCHQPSAQYVCITFHKFYIIMLLKFVNILFN